MSSLPHDATRTQLKRQQTKKENSTNQTPSCCRILSISLAHSPTAMSFCQPPLESSHNARARASRTRSCFPCCRVRTDAREAVWTLCAAPTPPLMYLSMVKTGDSMEICIHLYGVFTCGLLIMRTACAWEMHTPSTKPRYTPYIYFRKSHPEPRAWFCLMQSRMLLRPCRTGYFNPFKSRKTIAFSGSQNGQMLWMQKTRTFNANDH